jgi:hypothetical protein
MRKTAVLAVALCGLLAAAGCGGRRLEPPVEPGQAGEVLRAAFDAWKNGEPYGALDTHDPPIYFNEREWEAGKKLVSYEAGPVTLMGRQGRCLVKLTLQDKQGSSTTRAIGYLIDTTPRLVITREALGP